MFKKMIYVFLLLLIPLYVFPISWEIETDIGITMELRDETSTYDYINKHLNTNYEFVQVIIKNDNRNVNFEFYPGYSKALFIDGKEVTYRAVDIYLNILFAAIGGSNIEQGLAELFKPIKLAYKESATILLAMPDGFDFFKAKIFKIQFGPGLYIEYYKKGKEIVIIDEYNKLNLEEE